jgi:hypothetical protein
VPGSWRSRYGPASEIVVSANKTFTWKYLKVWADAPLPQYSNDTKTLTKLNRCARIRVLGCHWYAKSGSVFAGLQHNYCSSDHLLLDTL